MKILNFLWSICAIRNIFSIFNNDAHHIISKKGWEIINK